MIKKMKISTLKNYACKNFPSVSDGEEIERILRERGFCKTAQTEEFSKVLTPQESALKALYEFDGLLGGEVEEIVYRRIAGGGSRQAQIVVFYKKLPI